MIEYFKNNRYLILRRTTQAGLLLLFGGAQWWGWKLLTGTYSSTRVFELFYLSDPHAVLQAMAAGFVMSSDALIGALIILAFYALLAGRSFCSWVCPLNMVTDLAKWTRGKLKLSGHENLIKINRKTRYWVLGIGLVVSWFAGIAAFEIINPITIFHRGIIFGIGLGWMAVAAVFLFDVLVVEHGWCGHLCPLGAFYTIISRFALVKVSHDTEKCTLCMKCKDVCHEEQVLFLIGEDSGYIRGACSICARCIEVCDDDALKFSVFNYKT